MKNFLLCLVFGMALPSFAATKLVSEAQLLAWSQEHAPQLDEIKASLLNTSTQKNLIEEKYGAEVFGRAAYGETQERPIIQFIPIFSPYKQGELGIRKKFSKGIDTRLSVSTDQRSANSPLSGTYRDVTTTIVSFTTQIDLWRDLLGRVSDAEKENAQLDVERVRMESEIRGRVFQISLRRIYWTLVATAEQLKIADELKRTATRQVQDAKNRLRSSIGDAGEVARYEAQLASREGQLVFFTYQKEILLKQLKLMLPNLGVDELALDTYDIEKTIGQVLECSSVIMGEPKVPYKYTKYDEIVEMLKSSRRNQKTMNERYSDVDVKLFGTVKSTGIGSDSIGSSEYRGNYGDSYEDMTNHNRAGYEAGLNFVLPIGGSKEATQETKHHYDEKRFKAMIDSTEANLVSTHTQLAKSMKLIQQIIASERLATIALEKRMSSVMRKYDQARVSVNDLILDQDALLNSRLSTIDAQLQAVNLMLDYFAVFTDTPCVFNGSST